MHKRLKYLLMNKTVLLRDLVDDIVYWTEEALD
jgi:hypothetical protein